MGTVKRKVYRKANNLFVGEVFDEMLDDEVLTDLRTKIVYNSSYLNKAVSLSPKIVAVRSFEDTTKDSLVLNTIIEKSPTSKIILIGSSKDSFKKNIRDHISACLPKDTNFEAFKTAFDTVSFEHSYRENFNESALEFEGMNPMISKVIWTVIGSSLFFLSLLLFYLLE